VAFRRAHGVRIGDHLTLRGVADDLFAIALNPTTEGVVFVPSGFGMTLTLPSLQIGDDRIGRPQVDRFFHFLFLRPYRPFFPLPSHSRRPLECLSSHSRLYKTD
jgi:hypothetical protein